MDFEKINIKELLPQQPPFIMVDTLVHYDDTNTVTRTQVRADNIFVDNNVFSSSGLIENIAQTCATRIGYINKYILKKSVKLGFIGAIRNMHISALPNVGDTITTDVEIIQDVFNMTLANASITCDGKQLATAEIKIALSDKDSKSAN